MKTLKLTITALCFLVIITACEKEGPIGPQGTLGEQGPRGETGSNGPKGDKGDTGAQGPKGDKGNTGAQGPKGNTGPQGKPGTANVVASAWADYDWNLYDTSNSKSMKVVVPSSALEKLGTASLNEFMASGGVLLVYGKNETITYAFPFSYDSYAFFLLYDSANNEFSINLRSLNDQPLPKGIYETEYGNQFRYVLIAPGSLISGYKSKEVKWASMDYENASQLLGIKD